MSLIKIDNMTKYLKRLLPIVTISILTQQSVIAAETSTEEEKDAPRWFQIEIIAIKNNTQTNLLDESWDKKSQLTYPENMVDFLQPFAEIEPELTETDGKQLSTESVNPTATGNQININDATHSKPESEVENAVENGEKNGAEFDSSNTAGMLVDKEQPFILLPDSEFQLANEEQVLQRDPAYQVLLHIAWRQPVLDKADATFVRIGGGYDYKDTFRLDGSKIEPESESETSNTDGNDESGTVTENSKIGNSEKNLQQAEETDSKLLATENAPLENGKADIVSSELVPNDTDEQKTKTVALPWVPELDGSIQVYLKRYLHLNTRLYLRRPDKEAVDLIDLSSEKLNIHDLNVSKSDGTNGSLNGENLPVSNNAITAMNSDSAKSEKPIDGNLLSGGFDWQIGDDFLIEKPQQSFVERLFNYPVEQSRRMRSKELHYIDHPLVGLLIIITPYEPNQNDLADDPLVESQQ